MKRQVPDFNNPPLKENYGPLIPFTVVMAMLAVLVIRAVSYGEGVSRFPEDEGIVVPARPRVVQPQPPTPLEPGVLRNYDYVTEHKADWRAAEKQFVTAVREWQQGDMCNREFFLIADRVSPRFQAGLPSDLVEKMERRGWQPLYYDLRKLDSEPWGPSCNNPECRWCCANDPEHLVKFLARVEHRKEYYRQLEQARRTNRGLPPVKEKPQEEVVPARKPDLIPIPAPDLKPEPDPEKEQKPKPKRRTPRNTASL